MWNSVFSLFRGVARRTVSGLLDTNTLTFRDPQTAQYTEAVGWARKAVVVAVAKNRQEQAYIEKLCRRITDLKRRAGLALSAGNERSAREVAEAIASLENERDRVIKTISGFSAEFTRLRRMVGTAEHRLKNRRNMREAAKANEVDPKRGYQAQTTGGGDRDAHCEAETALAVLQSRQDEIHRANDVLDGFGAEPDPVTIMRKMADAGFGLPAKGHADEVFARLRAHHKTRRQLTPSAGTASRRRLHQAKP